MLAYFSFEKMLVFLPAELTFCYQSNTLCHPL
uniref:Uncharacterized protein n=1 Tax=Rhizophora mucronata TaxID=61149 RepID=A0A2P2N2H9_RHIMU